MCRCACLPRRWREQFGPWDYFCGIGINCANPRFTTASVERRGSVVGITPQGLALGKFRRAYEKSTRGSVWVVQPMATVHTSRMENSEPRHYRMCSFHKHGEI